MSSLSNAYRLEVASRVLAAIVGGYVLASLATAVLAVVLPMPRAEATLTATMLSFAIYACIVLWVFATRSVWRVWAGVVVPAVALNALLWLRQLWVGV
ncbi:MAG TPA: DUF3649 domain-containing protein [Steroidobacteraceae bacterium]|jgi:hypothetical protein